MDYSVWGVLESKVCAKPYKNLTSLKKALIKAWEEIEIPYLRATVDDFPKRIQACIDANGGIFEK